ncbi:outer membrane beta-barrel protein [Postechiella marina]|uniref:Outer membrane beta-barrel protein n=1 Tax=Postechiella marina TaxID=943941 RepID=A0ABP8CA93_9FLAO
MNKFCFYLAVFCITITFSKAFSQSKSFQISGTIIAQDDNNPLESATVYLQQIADSTLVTYDISDDHGEFYLEGKTNQKQLNLFISYVGFKKHAQIIKIDTEKIDLHAIILEPDNNVLDAVVVKSSAPVMIKKDTLEFNVRSFKTKRDANVEDLLKELPGVEVDEDGKLIINGKEVDKILVNGKPFFAGDPTITTRNLTKDLIKKIQIMDTRTKAEAFAGEQGDKTHKTLNLVIDEKKNRGVFGRLSAGLGTDKHYEYAGMFNYFDNDQRLSVLSGGNDINSPGFSFGEIRKMFGGGNGISIKNGSLGGSQGYGAGKGLVESENIGANYADELGSLVDMTANYFYSGSESDDKSETQRENILADGTRYYTNSKSTSFNNSTNHSSNLDFDIEIDSTFLINISPSFKYAKNEQISRSSSDARNADNELTNQSQSESIIDNTTQRLRNKLYATKRIGNKGAFVKLYMTSDMNNSKTDNLLNSETNFFEENSTSEDILRDQTIDSDDKTGNTFIFSSYRLPILANELFLDFRYSYRRIKRENTKSTFDFDDVTGGYTSFNADLSKNYEHITATSSPSLRLEYRKKNWSTSIQSTYLSRNLENKDALRPVTNLKRKLEALEVRYRFNYRFSSKSSVGFNYTLDNEAPQIGRLQNFRDETNPLHVYTGNPDLKASNSHKINLHYKVFNFQKDTDFYTYFNASIDRDSPISKTIIDDNLARETTYTNVNGGYNVNGRISFSKQVKIDSVKTVKFYVGVRPSVRKSINFNNGVQYASTVKSVGPSLGLRLRWRDVLEFSPRYRLSFTKNSYDIDSFNDQEFLYHSLNLRSATFLPKDFEWRNNVSFSYNPNIAAGFQKSAWFWNSTLAYSVLKDQGTMTLKVYDLLNQNTNARRIATQNYIQDSQSTVLQQYFMLSFSWKFNSLGKAGIINKGKYSRG